MRAQFPQYYQFTEAEFSQLLDDCTFVFDANVLLNLYRYPQATREDFLTILKKLAADKRIWLPFQAALEFQDNRLSVIADQKNKFSKVRKIIEESKDQLKVKLDDLQLRKRHPSIDPDTLLKRIDRAFKDYLAKLDGLESGQPDVHQDDRIRTQVDDIFTPFLGQGLSKEDLGKIQEEGEKRYKVEQPPGYKDVAEKKESVRFHRDLAIKRKFGDLIVWKEIIAFAKQAKPKGVVFITDDSKEDWWLEVGGKSIGPRPDLVSEFHHETGLLNFYAYNSERFMQVMSERLHITIRPESIQDVKTITALDIRPISETQKRARELRRIYSGKCQICGFDEATEVALIRPIEQGGHPALSNMLLLCPNHHRILDLGLITIDKDFNLVGLKGALTVAPAHEISSDSITYHSKHIYEPPTPDTSAP